MAYQELAIPSSCPAITRLWHEEESLHTLSLADRAPGVALVSGTQDAALAAHKESVLMGHVSGCEGKVRGQRWQALPGFAAIHRYPHAFLRAHDVEFVARDGESGEPSGP